MNAINESELDELLGRFVNHFGAEAIQNHVGFPLMRAEGYRVLVVGAGIAGLAAARALAGWSTRVEVVEGAAVVGGDGAGICLPGNAFRALDALGLGSAVRAASVGGGSAVVVMRAGPADRRRRARHLTEHGRRCSHGR